MLHTGLFHFLGKTLSYMALSQRKTSSFNLWLRMNFGNTYSRKPVLCLESTWSPNWIWHWMPPNLQALSRVTGWVPSRIASRHWWGKIIQITPWIPKHTPYFCYVFITWHTQLLSCDCLTCTYRRPNWTGSLESMFWSEKKYFLRKSKISVSSMPCSLSVLLWSTQLTEINIENYYLMRLPYTYTMFQSRSLAIISLL